MWDRRCKRVAKNLKNWMVDFPMEPGVSTATGWKMKRRPKSAYLAIFLTSAASATDVAASATDVAASATDVAASAVSIRFEDVNVLTHVASQMGQRPHEQGYTVIPSGRQNQTVRVWTVFQLQKGHVERRRLGRNGEECALH